jgi:hypothetical protein
LYANVATDPGVRKRVDDLPRPRRKIEQPFFEILSLPPGLAISVTRIIIFHSPFFTLHEAMSRGRPLWPRNAPGASVGFCLVLSE